MHTMLGTAKNFDVICFQLRNYYPQLENPLKKDLDSLLTEVRQILIAEKQIKPRVNSLLGSIFNLRVKAIMWLVKENDLDLSDLFNEIIPQIGELKDDPKLEVLAENILFALRCNQRVIDALTKHEVLSMETISGEVSKLTPINYEQFIASIALGVPDNDVAQKIIDLSNASLCIEFATLAASIIHEEKLSIPNKGINELAFIVADAAQEYSAIAMDLGILRQHSSRALSQNLFDEDFIKEQKDLSDLGLTDFSKQLN